jgi:hypothetical protein
MSSVHLGALCAAALALAPAAAAQGRHVFVIDAPQSTFSFNGTATLGTISGPIVGNPATFSVSGTSDIDLTVSAGVLTTGEMVRGNSVVVLPTLNAFVPNPIPIFPPLATVTVTGLQVVFRSVDPGTLAPLPFAIGSGGAFTASVVADILTGEATVTILGNTQVVPLSGISGTPQPVSGTIVATPSGFQLHTSIASSFAFSDPGTGASGTLNISGNLLADDLPLATDVDTVSLGTGGTQHMTHSAGTAFAGEIYWVLGSFSGTSPGLNLGPFTLPLNVDNYTVNTAVFPNAFPLATSVGFLDALGTGSTTFSFPVLPIPALYGLQFHHAYLVIDSGNNFVFASNAVPVTLTP